LRLSIIITIFFFYVFEHLLSNEPYNQAQYSELSAHDIIDHKFNGFLMPYLNNNHSQSDSIFNLMVYNSIQISDFKPEINTSFIMSGVDGYFSFFIEPIMTNAIYGKKNLGSTYSRNNVSVRFKNAFIKYEKNNIKVVFGRTHLWWGQSNRSSIIQNYSYPNFDKLAFKYKKGKYFYEAFVGQLNSKYNNENYRIRRNIGGHRLVWRPLKNMLFGIGEKIIYTGRNRGIELIYLNPFIPYIFTSLEKNEESFPYDNDNSMIFGDFRYLLRKNLSLYGELIIDDIQIDDTNVDNATGIKLGLDGKFNDRLIYIFEYTKINPWTYIHHGQFTSWEQNYHPLGFKYGPNVECLHFKTIFEINNYDIIFDFNLLEKGRNNIFSEWNNSLSENKLYLKNYVIYNFAVIRNFQTLRTEFGWKSKSFNLDPTVEYFYKNVKINGTYYLKMFFEFNKDFVNYSKYK
jgi:hypothetical protein